MKMKRRFMNNKGYSMVEMIICIGIIVVLSGIAFLTVTMIHSAKAKEASVTFESEIADAITKSKGQLCMVAGTEQPQYKYMIKLYKHSNGKYYIKRGYYNPSGGAGELTLENAGDVSDKKYTFVKGENRNDDKGVTISNRVEIRYKEAGGTEKLISAEAGADKISEVYIVFDKNGACLEGMGDYTFYKKNGNEIAVVNLKKNGSHQSD